MNKESIIVATLRPVSEEAISTGASSKQSESNLRVTDVELCVDVLEEHVPDDPVRCFNEGERKEQ